MQGASGPVAAPREGADARTPPGPWRARVVLGLKLALAAGLIAYMAGSGKIRWAALRPGFAAPWTLVYAVLGVGLTIACGTFRWWLLLKAVDVELPLRKVLQLNLIGHFFNTFMPGSVGGDPLKALYATRHAPPGRKVEAATTVFCDRLLGLGTLVAIAGLGLLAVPLLGADDPAYWRAAAGLEERFGPALIAVAAAGGLSALVLLGLSVPRVRRSPAVRWVAGWVPGLDLLRRAGRTALTALTHKAAVAGAVLASAVAHLSTITVFFALGSALGPTLTALQHLYVVPLGLTINAVPGPPAGFGVGELAFESLYNLALAAEASNGAETCLMWRVVIVFWNLVGGVAYILHRAPAPAADAEGSG